MSGPPPAPRPPFDDELWDAYENGKPRPRPWERRGHSPTVSVPPAANGQHAPPMPPANDSGDSTQINGADDDSILFPEFLTSIWDQLDDANRRKLRGPWDEPGRNYRVSVDLCVILLRHHGLTLEQVIEAARCFPEGFGRLGHHASLIRDLWREQDEIERAAKPRGGDLTGNWWLTREAAANPLGIWDAGDDDYEIEPRGWLLGNILCRKFLSSLIADGGVGKTALRIAQLISLAIGRSLTGEHVFLRCRVLILSLEDDKDELRRRVYAVMLKYGIKPEDVKGWLFLAAPKNLKLAEMVEGSPQASQLEGMIRSEVVSRKVDIVSLDPFIKSHSLDENSNNAIDYVCGLLVCIAIDLDCAVDWPVRNLRIDGTHLWSRRTRHIGSALCVKAHGFSCRDG
jgi:hypothetical protein